jgi:hypothetical protein
MSRRGARRDGPATPAKRLAVRRLAGAKEGVGATIEGAGDRFTTRAVLVLDQSNLARVPAGIAPGGAVLPNLLDYRGSIVTTDIKGEVLRGIGASAGEPPRQRWREVGSLSHGIMPSA